MSTKYDTNPLDPDFPEQLKREAEAQAATQVLPQGIGETQRFAPETEEQTRRFVEADHAAFQQPFNGQFVPAVAQNFNVSTTDGSIYRKVEKLGLPENVLTAVPYIPWFLGLVAGILLLLLTPKSEQKVRFHAAQGVAAHIGILIVTTILGVVNNVSDIADVGAAIFTLVTSIMLVIFALKAWQGKPVHIESIEDLTNWFEDKIEPKLAKK